MLSVIDVNTGEVRLAHGKGILRAVALGSCVAVSAYDPPTGTAGMAHIMLPGKAPKSKESLPNRYTANALDFMLHRLKKRGVRQENLIVCLTGGGNVLNDRHDTICKSLIASVMQELKVRNILCQAKKLGGNLRRSLSLNAADGTVVYTEGNSGERLLWRKTKKLRIEAVDNEQKKDPIRKTAEA